MVVVRGMVGVALTVAPMPGTSVAVADTATVEVSVAVVVMLGVVEAMLVADSVTLGTVADTAVAVGKPDVGVPPVSTVAVTVVEAAAEAVTVRDWVNARAATLRPCAPSPRTGVGCSTLAPTMSRPHSATATVLVPIRIRPPMAVVLSRVPNPHEIALVSHRLTSLCAARDRPSL